MPIKLLRRLWHRRNSPYAQADWQHLFAQLPAAAHLNRRERDRLARLAIDFLADKTIEGGGDTRVDERDHLLIAANACIPVLRLGLGWYDGWYSVLVYADAFISSGEYTDPFGIVHRNPRVLSGEAWLRGPVILARDDVLASMTPQDGNVVIHEFAHKLDMRNGTANGMPPLHRGMDRRTWTQALSRGYQTLCTSLESENPLPFNPYACESPGEFFAVMSEVFFMDPDHLRRHLADVYQQFTLFYRQQPAT